MTGRPARALAALAGACLLAAPAEAQEVEGLLLHKGLQKGDQVLAGGVVEVRGKVEGDLTMLGAQAALDGIVTGDVNVAGGVVQVAGVVGDDVRALGGVVVVQGIVADGLLVGGGEITVTPNTRVGGRAVLGARRVLAQGDFDADLLAAGEHVEIAGDLHGRVRILSDDVVVRRKARVDGDLVVVGANPPRVEDGARVGGRIVVEAGPGGALGARLRGWLRALAMQVGMLLVAWSWLVFAPGVARRAAALAWRRILLDLGIGMAVAFGLPVVAGLLAVSVVGLPLAVGVAAVWAVLLLVGWVSTAVCLGGWLRGLLRRSAAPPGIGGELPWIFVALVLLRAGAAIPWIGPAVGMGALLAGAGAVARAVQEAHGRARLSRAPRGPAAA